MHAPRSSLPDPIANFILAIVIFTGLFTFFGKPSTTARVDTVQAGSAAEAAGFKPGDVVTAINGDKIDSFSDMQRIVAISAGDTLTIAVKRGDLRSGSARDTAAQGYQGRLRQRAPDWRSRNYARDLAGRCHRPNASNPATALWLGVKETWFVVDRTLAYIGGIFTGREAADQVGGPLRIAQISGQVATIGLAALIHLAAVLSVSIGLLNLFPVPLLDGGHLLFYAVEAIRGTPFVGPRAGNGISNRAGPGADADGVRDLQRHLAFGRVLSRSSQAWPMGNVLE